MAALHFNENFGCEQSRTASGSERIKIVFPKQKKRIYPETSTSSKILQYVSMYTLYSLPIS